MSLVRSVWRRHLAPSPLPQSTAAQPRHRSQLAPSLPRSHEGAGPHLQYTGSCKLGAVPLKLKGFRCEIRASRREFRSVCYETGTFRPELSGFGSSIGTSPGESGGFRYEARVFRLELRSFRPRTRGLCTQQRCLGETVGTSTAETSAEETGSSSAASVSDADHASSAGYDSDERMASSSAASDTDEDTASSSGRPESGVERRRARRREMAREEEAGVGVMGFETEFVIRRQAQDLVDGRPEPFQSLTFVKPLSRVLGPRKACRICQGSGLVPCACCSGLGLLSRGGYQKKNPVSVDRIVDSKWTAMERTFGWRHFRVESKRRSGGAWFVEMVATCDASTRFWVNARNLRERERWSMGWLQKEELMGTAEGKEQLACKACKGGARQPCPKCAVTQEGEARGDRLDVIEV